jgi:hypothetical protein
MRMNSREPRVTVTSLVRHADAATAARDGDAVDIVIAGGGTVGLSLALAIARADRHAGVAVVDATPPGRSGDNRASAIAAAARRMLTRLGVWSAVEGEAQPIREMIVTDSRLADVVRPVLLGFGGEVEAGEPFAHMVPNGPADHPRSPRRRSKRASASSRRRPSTISSSAPTTCASRSPTAGR